MLDQNQFIRARTGPLFAASKAVNRTAGPGNPAVNETAEEKMNMTQQMKGRQFIRSAVGAVSLVGFVNDYGPATSNILDPSLVSGSHSLGDLSHRNT